MRAAALGVALTCLLGATQAVARPPYFDALTSRYGFGEGDRLYACGVCHFKWEGTGARNPFGDAVQQQLYVGKSIQASLTDVEAADSDGDGFTNLEELTAPNLTLPGYSCANFFEAVGAPANHHSFITPLVPSCLDPHDIRTDVTQISFVTLIGKPPVSRRVEIFNNGIDEPLIVQSYALGVGAPSSLQLSGPVTPFTLQVGESATIQVSFDPPMNTIAETALTISSDDPDEPTLTIPVSALGVTDMLAGAGKRKRCLADIDKHFRRYTKVHLREWSRCYADEAAGRACAVGRREAALGRAEAKLRKVLGGARDRRCRGASLSPALLGFEEFCGGGCGVHRLDGFDDLVDCLICRQGEETDRLIGEAIGASPPDLPAGDLERAAFACQRKLLGASQRGIRKAQALFGRCELENTGAADPMDCTAELAEDLAAIRAKTDAAIDRCKDTTGLAGCLFAEEPAPGCLGDTAVGIAGDLVDAAYGLDED